MTNYGAATEISISKVIEACRRYGERSIVALSGVPGTGKSFAASIAAQRFTEEPLLVREIQFHQSFSYEEFIEGMRIDSSSEVSVAPGVFLEWNERALDDPDRRYVLLIEEFTRANLAAVLGELLTFLEHRNRPFLTVYSRKPVRVAKNITLLVTFNPIDRTAIDLDAALIRRLRIIHFSPDTDQLAEMLSGRLSAKVVQALTRIFLECKAKFPREYDYLMPFGHGVFSEVGSEADLHLLWNQRLAHILRRPLVESHPFADFIEGLYPWVKHDYRVP